MSLNGLMGVGIASAGVQNPWDAKSPVAVDFRRPEGIDGRSEMKTSNEPLMPEDYVTLHSGEEQVVSPGVASDEVEGMFRTVA